jgi:hypothetical protein
VSQDERRTEELRIHALGAAISRRDWHAVERAHADIRDAFASPRIETSDEALERAAKIADMEAEKRARLALLTLRTQRFAVGWTRAHTWHRS